MSKRLEMLEKLLAAGSQDPFHHYARALELRSLARGTEALAALAQVTRDYPEYVPSYLIAAQLAAQAGDAAAAEDFCDRGVAAAERAGNEHALSELRDLRATLGG
jgi:hypothetical protein